METCKVKTTLYQYIKLGAITQL